MYNGLLNNHFISNFIILFAGETTFKIGQHLAKFFFSFLKLKLVKFVVFSWSYFFHFKLLSL